MPKTVSSIPVYLNQDFFSKFDRFVKTIFIGNAPQIFIDHCLVGDMERMKSSITVKIEKIIKHSDHKGKSYKFGKTGFAPTRVDQDDYRKASYSKMYLLFESETVEDIELLEMYYSKKYKGKRRCDNKDTNSLGKMTTIDGKHFLYLVI